MSRQDDERGDEQRSGGGDGDGDDATAQSQEESRTAASVAPPAAEPASSKSAAKKGSGGDSRWKRMKDGAVRVFNSIKWVLLVIIVLVVVALLARWNVDRTKRYSPAALDKVKQLVEYAGKSAEEAERTQHDPMQSLLHANYAVCYVNAAKHMVDDETLQKLVVTDMAELEEYLKQLQQRAIQLVEHQATSTPNDAATRNTRRPAPRNANQAVRPGVSVP